MADVKEPKRIVLSLDNTEMLKSLDEVEKKLDKVIEKANQLKSTLQIISHLSGKDKE